MNIHKFKTLTFLVRVFWVMTPCTLARGYRHFGGPCWLHLQGEVRGSGHIIIFVKIKFLLLLKGSFKLDVSRVPSKSKSYTTLGNTMKNCNIDLISSSNSESDYIIYLFIYFLNI
jgi:hypothetical protein